MFLDQLDQYQKLKLVDGLQTLTFHKDQFILKEGEEGKEFYIVDQGEVECLKLYQLRNKMGFVHVRSLHKGEHFGELALINNEKRSLSIRVKSEECVLLKLDRETFSRILGSIDMHLMKDYNKEFDRKIEDIKLNKRTFSQQFHNQDFEQIQQMRNMG